MTNFSTLTRRTVVRPEYSEEAVYGYGFVVCTDGSLDAPTWIPLGSTESHGTRVSGSVLPR